MNRNHIPLRVIVAGVLFFIVALCSSFAQDIPAPEQILGFKVGADSKLADYDQAVEYLEALEKASPMIKLFEMGKTGMGKPMIYAVITSEENMSKLDHYKEISKKLALVTGLTDKEASRLASTGKAIVYLEGGVHAGECAPTQSQIQLAYDLLTSNDPDIRLVLDDVILLLAFADPDGMQLLAEWYLPNVDTSYETSPQPWLTNKYAGGNINRDAYMGNLDETRNIVRLVNREWYPVILYSHHQTAPFPARIWIPPAAEPTNPNLHPLFIRGKNLIGSVMGYEFDLEGKPGAISRIVFDFWYPGYLDNFCDFFNVVSIMTETALYKYATPHFYTLDDFPDDYKEFTIGAFYPSPWKGGWWRFRDAVDYSLTASKSALYAAALHREKFLYAKYQMGRDTIARFKNEPPYAWIIPQQQWDPPTAAHLLNWLITMGIKVYEAEESFVYGQNTYPSGTWVIPADQPFSLYVKALFEEQDYPDLTKYPSLWQGIVGPRKFTDAYLPPYDLAGWTVPYQMGVKVSTANTPLVASLVPIAEAEPPTGKVEGSAEYAYLLSPQTNNSFKAINRVLKEGGEVLRAKDSFSVGGESYPPGSYLVLATGVSPSFMSSLAKELHLSIKGTGSEVGAKTYRLESPRIALYTSWLANSDEGWTRWLFEQYEFPFTNIHDAEVRAGNLRKNFDVVVLPSTDSSSLIDGHKPGTIHPQYTGGITRAGVESLHQFVDEGGTLVALNSSCLFAIESLGLPVQDSLKGLRPPPRGYGEAMEAKAAKFACPGSVLRMEFNTGHPVAYGMPPEAPAMFANSPAFTMLSSFEKEKALAVGKYPGKDLLMSGYLMGEEYLKNKVSVVDVPLGKGRVILLGFGVQQRAQPHGTFKLLFNSMYYNGSQ